MDIPISAFYYQQLHGLTEAGCRMAWTLPSLNRRYSRDSLEPPKLTFTTQGDYHMDGTTPGWVAGIRPRGNTYYWHLEDRVISTSTPRDKTQYSQVLDAVREQLPLNLMGDNFEIFLDLQDSRSSSERVIRYYIVDHDNRTIVWPPSTNKCSETVPQLSSALRTEYWIHMQTFAHHRSDREYESEKELIASLRHTCIDDMISPGSSCPYSSEECAQYAQLRESCEGGRKYH